MVYTIDMIDLYSDTLTRPTPAMREAMAAAPVGDEQLREDPTTTLLQKRVAELLGKETALFLPTGTMCNAVAIKTHTHASDTIFVERTAHIHRSEFGGTALLSGATTETLDGVGGIYSADQLAKRMEHFHSYGPVPRLVCIEQTHNFGGGTIWPLQQLREVCSVAREHGLKTHMDGARLFNASVASGIEPSAFAATVDSVWIDLSKGLGCPVGGVLAGANAFIERAWRFKHLFGGAMRQSGILAAAGLYALEHHIERLRDDHENAKLLARGLQGIPGVTVDNPAPETNIVFFSVPRELAKDFGKKSQAEGVRFSGSEDRIRAVTHLDVSREEIERAIEIIRKLVAG